MTKNEWIQLEYSRRCKDSKHIYTLPTQGRSIVWKNEGIYAGMQKPTGRDEHNAVFPLSVLHSVVTHTTGVYQWLAASHTHNALHQ